MSSPAGRGAKLRGAARGAVAAALALACVPSAWGQGLGRATEVSTSADGGPAGITVKTTGKDVGYLQDTVGGVPCVRTDGASGKHWLLFDVDDKFAFQENADMTLLVEYWDAPAGLMSIRYDASDDAGGPIAQAYRGMRTGELRWVTLSLPLKSCYFSNRTHGAGDITITGFTHTGDARAADVAIASLRLLRAHMRLEVKPDAVPAQGSPNARTVELTAKLWAAPLLQPPDGQEVVFRIPGAQLEQRVTSEGGIARTTLAAPPQPGRLSVTATWGDVTAEAGLFALPTDKPAVEQDLAVCGFEPDQAVKIKLISAKDSLIRYDTDVRIEGKSSLRLDYLFEDPPTQGQPTVMIQLDQPLPGRPKRLSCEVYGDGSGQMMLFVVADAQEERFAFLAGPVRHVGWATLACDLVEADADDDWGPPGVNGKFDLPLKLDHIRLVKSVAGTSGTVRLDDLRAVCVAPEEAGATTETTPR